MGSIRPEFTQIRWFSFSYGARQEAGPCQRRSKALKGELGNNCRKPSQKIGIVAGLKWFNLLYIRDRRRREMKLLMIKMMMMQCVTRTSGSDTLCPEELFLSTHTSQLVLAAGYSVFYETGLFVTGTIKSFFLFPAIQSFVNFPSYKSQRMFTYMTVCFDLLIITEGIKIYYDGDSVYCTLHSREN
jgi:hypothetical protein